MKKSSKLLALLLALTMLLSLAACGKKNGDAGYYILTAMTIGGETIEGDDLKEYTEMTGSKIYIELKEDQTGVICMGDDEEMPFTWKSGVITADGEEFNYALKDGVLTLEIEGTAMVFTKSEKGSSGGGLSGPKLPSIGKKDGDAGYYIMTSLTADGKTMEEDLLKQIYGEEGVHLELKEDGTGTMGAAGEEMELTWEPGVITADGDKMKYTLKGDELTLEMEGSTMVFTRGEKPSGSGLNGPKAPTGTGGGETIVIGDFTIVFKGYELLTDSLGYDIIHLTYDFTNGSKTVAIFGAGFWFEAEQAGEELHTSYSDDLLVNDDARVQSGETVEVKYPFKLKNTTDDVTIRFSDIDGEEEYTQTIKLSGGGGSKPGKPSKPSKPSSGPASLADYWEGDWYGGWYVQSADGYWEELETCWWDCCARITMYDESSGYVELWDEDGSGNDEYMIECEVSFGPGTTDYGCMMSEEGYFWDYDIGHADWIVDPGASMVSQYEHMICIDGTYEDPENGGGFSYMIFLKPWGVDWEDVAENDENLLPDYYYDWYVSGIQNGIDMPDEIGANG